jgi:hypothetical protein
MISHTVADQLHAELRGLPRQRERVAARLSGFIDADAAWEEALIPFVVTEASAAAAVRERVLQLRELLDNANRASGC